MAKRIGGDWVENTDPTSGRKYYANLKTKQTSWTYPEELKQQEESNGTSEDLSQWAEKQDPSSGRMYYYNRVSKQTTWSAPEGWAAYKASQNGGGSSSSSSSTTTTTTTATQQTTTTATQQPQPTASSESKATGDPEEDPSNWHSKVDANSGRTYYFNTVSRKTQWNKPACLEEGGNTSKPTPTPPVKSTPAPSKPTPTTTTTTTTPAPDAASKKVAPPPSLAKETKKVAPPPSLTKAGSSPSASQAKQETSVAEEKKEEKVKETEEKKEKRTPSSRGRPESKGREEVEDNGEGLGEEEGKVDAYCDPILGMGSKQTTDDLIKQVEGISISQYAERYFNFDRKGIFGKRTTMDKILSWKPDVIRTSLRTLNSDMVHEATQSFRNITGFMGDRSTGKGTIDHAQKLLNNMLLAPEELRDEIFCQMVKQTNNNPSTESCTKGWQLMLIALAAFPPSAELQPHLMAYCVENLNSPQGNVPKLAELALHKIQKIVRLGPRREIPTKLEMEALRDGNPVVVRVWFLDEKYTMLKVDSWLTAEEFEEMIAHKLGIQDARSFSIFEVSSTEEERVLDADERILDLVAYWQRMEAEERQRKGKGAEIEEFKFFFKVRLFFDVEDDDTSAIEMMYIQAKHDVVDARYPCTEQDSVTLAALQVQEEFGDCPSDPSTCTYLRGNLDRFVAARYFDDGRETEIESQIMTLYGKLTGYSQLEARLSYLDYVKSWKIYGSSYYFAEPQNNREFPSEVVLAINNKGILVVDPETKDFLAEYPYQNVVTWGHSANSFVVVTGNMSRQVKVYFKTDQGKEMNQMVRQYVENIMS